MDVMEKSIVQSNPLIEARKEMTVSEMRLFALGLLDLMPHISATDTNKEEDFPVTLIPPNDLEKLFRGNTGGVANIRRWIKRAFDSSIEIRKDDGVSFTLRHIYEVMHYAKGEGLYIQFHKKMKEHLLELVGQQFTSIKAKEIFHLSGEYSWRLMELIQKQDGFMRKNKKAYLHMTVEELRFALNVPENAYTGRMDNFRKKVLNEPIEEINETTPYKVWYDVEKAGRRVAGFKIWVEMKTQEEKEKAAEERTEQDLIKALEENEYVKRLAELGVNVATAKVYAEKYAKYKERISKNIEFALENKAGKRNLAGWVLDCIDHDYARGQGLADDMMEKKQEETAEKEKKESLQRVLKSSVVDAGEESDIDVEKNPAMKRILKLKESIIKNQKGEEKG